MEFLILSMGTWVKLYSKVLAILSMVSLLRRVSKFINQYMGEALSRGVANLISGFFVKSGF